MESKVHETLQIVYEDGTVEALEHGCVIKLEPDENGDMLQLTMLFPNNTGTEEAETVLTALLGAFSQLIKS